MGGVAFFGLSTLITRRSLSKRFRANIPSYYQPNTRPNEINGGLEAFEALNVATLNVTAFSVMTIGGLLWATDISTVDDARVKVRGAMGLEGESAEVQRQANEEFEEWLASVLARKEDKEMAKEKAAKRTKETDRREDGGVD
jgi:hypothetical protein